MVRPLLLALLFGLTACASTLSTLQTAETTPRHHLTIQGGYGAFVPTGAAPHLARALSLEAKPLGGLVQTGRHPLPPKGQRDELLDTALSLALQTPGTVWEVGARFGLTDDWDVGGRYSSNDYGLDTKWRFWRREGAAGKLLQSAALDLRGSKVDLSNPVLDVLGYLNLDNFERYDLEALGLYTFDWQQILKLYAGPKVVLTYFSVDENLYEIANAVSDATHLPHATGSLSSTMQLFGGVLGISAGYKRVYGFLELDGGYTRLRPTILGERRDLSGLTFYPAVGVAGTI